MEPAPFTEREAAPDPAVHVAGNLRADNPDLALSTEEHARRRAAGEPEPLRVVITHGCAGIVPDQRMFDPGRGGPSIVVHTRPMTNARPTDRPSPHPSPLRSRPSARTRCSSTARRRPSTRR